MTATPHDSAALHKLFAPGELSRLLSDTAEVRAAMIVLGALAKAQGAAGEIPRCRTAQRPKAGPATS